MKKINLLYILILPFVISSCDFLEKFDHFGVGNTFEESFVIEASAGDGDTFSGSVEFSAQDDATIGDNLANIEEFDVTKISLRITKYTGDPTVVANGEFTVASNGLVVGTTVAITNLNFSDLASSEQELILPLSASTFSAIKEAYLNNQTLTVTAEGDISKSDTDVEAEVTIYMEVSATISN